MFVTEVKRLLAPSGRLAIVEIMKRSILFGPPLDHYFPVVFCERAGWMTVLEIRSLAMRYFVGVAMLIFMVCS